MSGANSTPLGKAHAALVTTKKATVSIGSSLLKPSYMAGGSNGGGAVPGLLSPPAIQACSIGAAAAAAAKAAAQLAITHKIKRESSPGAKSEYCASLCNTRIVFIAAIFS